MLVLIGLKSLFFDHSRLPILICQTVCVCVCVVAEGLAAVRMLEYGGSVGEGRFRFRTVEA